ncbi:hypothetical protein EOD39_11771 [Acipenser ruthenus]|uniref:HECT domain-containing protein n=1 Tax=Acipenser ruthenus TaxID=7906 RepID=A0A444UMZ8_ACIRT|nr:hypothetical protein EOD39_11771 [Acipenser ruthenus]
MNGSIGEDDHDELLEILSRMGCHTVPSLDDMKGTILQVAHKQLIQEPKYALDIMSNIIRSTLQMFLPDVSAIVALYEVTVKGVLKLIEAEVQNAAQNKTLQMFCEVQNAAQNKTLNFLKQFICSLHDERLQKFLRFVTGAEMIRVEKIEVQFTTLRGLERRPIVHTCGPLLEVPCTYNSYPEFGSEIQNILDGDCHRMDIM